MKAIRLLLLLASATHVCTHAGDATTNQPAAQTEIIVTSLKEGRPAVVVRPIYETPEFDAEVVRQWRTNYAVLSKALVDAATDAHLDSASLATILEKLLATPENKGLAVLPTEADNIILHGERAWRVSLRWDGERYAVAESGRLSHSRYFTFNQRTLEQLEFQTCY